MGINSVTVQCAYIVYTKDDNIGLVFGLENNEWDGITKLLIIMDDNYNFKLAKIKDNAALLDCDDSMFEIVDTNLDIDMKNTIDSIENISGKIDLINMYLFTAILKICDKYNLIISSYVNKSEIISEFAKLRYSKLYEKEISRPTVKQILYVASKNCSKKDFIDEYVEIVRINKHNLNMEMIASGIASDLLISVDSTILNTRIDYIVNGNNIEHDTALFIYIKEI